MRHRKGLTLIELIVALALAATLAVGALTVTVNLRRSQMRWSRSGGDGRSALRELLAADLLHADAARRIAGGFELRCRAALDPRTMKIHHLPAVIKYSVREVDGKYWLLRSQISESAGDFSELVCQGVRSITMESLEARPAAGRWRALDETATVSLLEDATDQRSTYEFQLR